MTHTHTHYLASDLDLTLDAGGTLWESLRGAHILLTGGTGYVGCWLIELALAANRRHHLGLRLTVMSRCPEKLRQRLPHLANDPALTLLRGDIRATNAIHGSWDLVIHAAAETNVALDSPSPMKVFDSCVIGTRNVLDLATRGGCRRFLFISSGAVYGKSAPRSVPIREDAPFESGPAYAHGKRAAEFLSREIAAENGYQATIARCFAFSGPYLPLRSGFAFGNFIADAIAGAPIVIKGDGSPLRSYMYGADMALWLWTILLKGNHGQHYNVGSDVPISIGQLARTIGELVGNDVDQVRILGTPDGLPPEAYVPDVSLARNSLALNLLFDLPHAIVRTAHWARLPEKY